MLVDNRSYFTIVRREPEEVQALLDWAREHSQTGQEHKTPYAAGVLETLTYLMGETDFPPQNYKGEFTMQNVQLHSKKI